MPFDIPGAVAAGYSPSEIADELAKTPDDSPIDVTGARKAGYSDSDILSQIYTPPSSGTGIGRMLNHLVPPSVDRGTAHMLEGVANTADVFGYPQTGAMLHGQVNQQDLNAPSSRTALGQNIAQGNILSALGNVPGAVGEAVPQLAAAVGGAFAGTAIAGPAGTVAGFAAGAGSDALIGIATQAGDIAKARAKADGRDTPNWQDIATAVGSSAVIGAMGRLGLGEAAGGILATAVKKLLGGEAPGVVTKALGNMAVHGASDAAQAVGQDVATGADTQQGVQVDPAQVAAQAVTGIGSRAALGGARTIQDNLNGTASASRDAANQAQLSDQFSSMTPEQQQNVRNVAAANKTLSDQANAPSANPQDVTQNVAARTAADGLKGDLTTLIRSLGSGDSAVLEPDDMKSLLGLVSTARNQQRGLDQDTVSQTLEGLPLAPEVSSQLSDGLQQLDMLSTAGVKSRDTSILGRAGGLVGSALGISTPHPFVGAQVGGYAGTRIGNWIADKMGLTSPALVREGTKAAMMLSAAGEDVPATREGLQNAIGQSQDSIKTQAASMGLDPENYGFTATEQRAMDRDAANAEKAKAAQTDAAYKQNTTDQQNATALQASKDAAFNQADADKQTQMDAMFRQMQSQSAAANAPPPNLNAVTRSQIAGFLADQARTAQGQTQEINRQTQASAAGDAQAAQAGSAMDQLQALSDRAGARVDRLAGKGGDDGVTSGTNAAMARLQALQEMARQAAPPEPTQAPQPQAAPTAQPAPQQAPTPPQAAPATNLSAPVPVDAPGSLPPMAQRLPDYQWKLGDNLSKALQLQGTPKNINIAQEVAKASNQAVDSGYYDKAFHDALMSHRGRVTMGLYNLLRNQMMLNHGIDRTTMDAQDAAQPQLAQAAE